MSAIAGIFYFGGAPAEPGLIEKLTSAMKTRGPDEQSHWVQGSVALGHCMLRTTPESLEEHQPLVSQDKNLVLVWDGRLDNRNELRRDLIAAGCVPRDNSDAELALQSYATWGEDCPKKLLGDFAFAVWDAGKQRLFCARDHVGARPFYYTSNDRFFAFASEDEPLLKLPGVSGRPNEDWIASILVPEFFSCCDPLQSWLADVRKVGAGQSAVMHRDGAIGFHDYWQLTHGKEAHYSSDQECQEAFLEVFGNSVRNRMRTKGDVAAMMSGGLDSASIAAMAKRLLPEFPGKAFHTYSAISDQPENCVESQCIQHITQDVGRNAHFVSVPSFTGMANIHDLLDIAWKGAQPVDNSILLQSVMCLAASRDGQRVLLHGASGDLATYFPDHYAAYLMRSGKWQAAWKECQAASQNHTSLRGVPPTILLMRNLWKLLPPVGLKFLLYRLHDNTQPSVLENSLINREFARKVRLEERLQAIKQAGREAGFLQLQEQQVKALFPRLVPNGLEGCERVAGRFGVELRDPWADRRVLEFFVALPLQYKVRQGWTKYLVRTVFGADLHSQVLWRTDKKHLGWNFIVRAVHESKELFAHLADKDIGLIEKYLDRQAAGSRLDGLLKKEDNNNTESLFWIGTLALWIQRIRGIAKI